MTTFEQSWHIDRSFEFLAAFDDNLGFVVSIGHQLGQLRFRGCAGCYLDEEMVEEVGHFSHFINGEDFFLLKYFEVVKNSETREDMRWMSAVIRMVHEKIPGNKHKYVQKVTHVWLWIPPGIRIPDDIRPLLHWTTALNETPHSRWQISKRHAWMISYNCWCVPLYDDWRTCEDIIPDLR